MYTLSTFGPKYLKRAIYVYSIYDCWCMPKKSNLYTYKWSMFSRKDLNRAIYVYFTYSAVPRQRNLCILYLLQCLKRAIYVYFVYVCSRRPKQSNLYIFYLQCLNRAIYVYSVYLCLLTQT